MFAVRPKQGVAYLRRCFSGNDWISKQRGTRDLRYYLFESLFIWDGGRVARSVRNARVGLRINVVGPITNLLRTKAYFIVGIMDKYIDRCYIFVYIIFD